MTEENPFASIRPELRSEEDDIRRGVFSQALKNLAQSTDEEKLRWRSVIETECKARRNSKTQPTTGAVQEELVGQKRERSSPDRLNDSEAAVEDARRYIGSFLHSQVEKVIGTTLYSLSPGTLRALCNILGIFPKTRNKDGLYSILASFHFTHCEKLGKRVSRSTYIDEQVKQDSDALLKALKPKAVSKPKQSVVKDDESLDSSPPLTHSTVVKSNDIKVQQPTRTAATDSYYPRADVFSGQQQSRSKVTEGENNATLKEETEGGVAYPTPAFRVAAPTAAPPARREDDHCWTQQRLEKSIATIVRNYDPVTTAIIVKKLEKMGFNSPDARSVVESCLQQFHQKKYIYYDNGIAYCMD